tara:strand:+ start:567 stop:791 length:225 start_codon:yes stop_codon:yes gene_type:complete
MAHTHKLIDGVRVDLTAEEIAELNAKDEIENKRMAELPSSEEVAAQTETDKSSGKQKLKDLGLTDAEIKALTGA